MKHFLRVLLAVFTCLAHVCADSPKPLADLETVYADFNDASGAVAYIDSGFVASYQGKGRGAWQKVLDAKRIELAAGLDKISTTGFSPEDARAVSLMRTTLASPFGDTEEKSAAKCADTQKKDLGEAALHAALYACFEELGNHVEFEGKKLTRVSALGLLSSLDEGERRKAAFLAFVPLWQAVNGNDEADSPYRRRVAQAIEDAKKRPSPVDVAAKTLGIPSNQVGPWLEQILDAWRQVSGDQMMEPWDFRYQAAQADRELEKVTSREAMLPATRRYYKDLGADLEKMGVINDLDTRPGKSPLAYTDYVSRGRWTNGVWQPTVVRVLGNYADGGIGLLNEFVHENGHAVHMMALRTRPAFMDLGDPLFYEAFADVTSWDTFDPAWQQRYLGKSAPESESLRSLYSGVILDVAWALFEVKMLEKPNADPNAVWSDITSKYLHVVPHPELSWWAVRVQLVEEPGYMVNYGLGSVLTADLREHVRKAIGPFAAGNAKWYPWISENLLKSGMEKETADLLRGFFGRPVSPDALLNDIKRIQKPKE